MDLTPHQQEALDWLVERLMDDASALVALRGLAGTGKTFLIPHLRDALQAQGLVVAIGAPTHRAAMILRNKGVQDADTVHSLALLPSFSPDYARAVQWLGGQCEARPSSDDVTHADVEDVPYLVAEYCLQDLAAAHAVRAQRHVFSPQRLLESLGIRGQDYFREFLPRAGDSCLILDEASMVDAELLSKCQQAFPRVCLVGDPGQLAPIDGESILASVEGFTLTEIHRQAADSPIVQLAYLARQGESFWRETQRTRGGEIETRLSVPASSFLTSPLLVYRNRVREECTKQIRAALGYETMRLMPGEPLVCRSTEPSDRALGFYNNAMFRIVAVSPTCPREITVVEDGNGEHEQTILAHLEELDGKKKDPKALWFRFGYAITVHTAQGGEWPTGYISRPELVWYQSRCARAHEEEEFARWSYTAITRAKQRLVFVAQHTFTGDDAMASATIAPPSAPMLAQAPDPLASEPDDIADPVTPPALLSAISAVSAVPVSAPPLHTQADIDQYVHESVQRTLEEQPIFQAHEALLQGFCQHIQQRVQAFMLEEHKGIMQTLDATLVALRKWVDTVGQQNEHSEYQLSDALLKLQERGLALRHDPYTATVAALNPAGFEVTITVAKQDTAELVTALPALLGWLAQEGFTAVSRGSLVNDSR